MAARGGRPFLLAAAITIMNIAVYNPCSLVQPWRAEEISAVLARLDMLKHFGQAADDEQQQEKKALVAQRRELLRRRAQARLQQQAAGDQPLELARWLARLVQA